MKESPRPDPASKPDAWSATMLIGALVLGVSGALWHFLSPRIKASRAKHIKRRKAL